MPNTQPFEVIAAPYEIYLAPTGEAFPAVNAAPAGNWTLVGTNGSRNYTEEGVTVAHAQTIVPWRGLGGTGPIKLFRTEEDLVIRATVVDMTLENYMLALNDNTVVSDAGPPATKTVKLYRGADVLTQYALLVRGESAYFDGPSQYQVPVVVHSGSPEVIYQKGVPAGLLLEFMAIEDPTAAAAADRFGELVHQTA